MFRYFFNILVYGNIWIALGASLMAIIHFEWNEVEIDWIYTITLFGASVFLYAIHRKVGLDENSEQYDIRYADFIKISKESNIICALGFIIMIGFGIFIPVQFWVWFTPAIISSGLYVMPLGKKKLRLRDYDIIKIPAQSIIWAWLIVIIPQVLSSNELSTSVWLIFIEKFLFLFAITIPFDIRDLKVDSAQGVKTLPNILGISRARFLAYSMIVICMIIVIILFLQNGYTLPFLIGLSISYAITFGLIKLSKGKDKDFWFSFILDGTLVLQPWLVMMLI